MENLNETKTRSVGKEAALRKPELRAIAMVKGLLMSRCRAPPLAAPRAAAALDGINGDRPDLPAEQQAKTQ